MIALKIPVIGRELAVELIPRSSFILYRLARNSFGADSFEIKKERAMTTDKKIIEVLNDLIKINNDRIEGYDKAAENVDTTEARLKSLFHQVAQESIDFRRELSKKVTELGGKPATDSTTAPGKIYRVWMDVKVTFSGDDTQATLNACEFGEDAAQKAYKEALKLGDDFPAAIIDMVQRQKNLLKMSHDLIKNMRDEYKEVEHNH